MILEYADLSNIRSYARQRIDFPKGSVLLSGDIGAGKSTILLAIEFALFGARRTDLSGEALLRNGAKEGSVELAFSIEGKRILVKRTLKRGNAGVSQEAGYMIIDGKKQDATAIELKSVMLNLLGYPKDLVTKSKDLIYRFTVFTPQEEMKKILFDDAEHRLDTLRKVFGIDKYKRIEENSAIITRSLRERVKEYSGMTYDLEDKKRLLEGAKITSKEAEQKLLSLAPALEKVKAFRAEKAAQLNAVEQQMRILADLRKEQSVIAARMKDKHVLLQRSVNEERIAIASGAELQSRMSLLSQQKIVLSAAQIEKDISEKDQKLRALMQKSSMLSERIRSSEKRIVELGKEIAVKSDLSQKFAAKKEKLSRLQEQLQVKNALLSQKESAEAESWKNGLEIREIEVKLSESSGRASGVLSLIICPTCDQEVKEEHKHNVAEKKEKTERELNERLQSLILSRTEKEKALRAVRERLDLLSILEREEAAARQSVKEQERIISELSVLSGQHRSLEQALAADRAESASLQSQDTSALAREIDNDREILKRMKEHVLLEESLNDKQKRVAELRAAVSQLQTEIASHERELAEIIIKISPLIASEQSYSLYKQQHEQAWNDEKAKELEDARLRKECEACQRIQGTLEGEVAQKESLKQKAQSLKQLQDWLSSHFSELMNVMEKHVLSNVHSEFSSLFRKWTDLLLNDESFAITLDKEFNPLVEQNGYDIDAAHLSGGEKTAVALAYRLALNKVINDVVSTIRTKDLIILDEPTDGFSSEQLDKVKEVIEELGIGQVIIVSHEQKVESFVQHVIHVEKQGHESRVV